MNNRTQTKSMAVRTRKKVRRYVHKHSGGVRIVAVFLATVMAFSALSANVSSIVRLLDVKAATDDGEVYPATLDLYDYYSDSGSSDHFTGFNQALYDSGYADKAGAWKNVNYFPLYLGIQWYNSDSNKDCSPMIDDVSKYRYSILANSNAAGTNGYGGAVLGLIDSKLYGGMPTQGGGRVALPYFDETFITSNGLGQTSKGHTFNFVKKDGLYTYDSTSQYLKYAGGTFDISDSVGSGYKQYNDELSHPAFFPFDVKDNTAESNNTASGTNFGFGAKFSIKFNMTKTGNFVGADGKDIKEGGKTKPIQFTFRGDDDVWVFIDDTLVLDVGGAHVANSASINFSTTDGTNPVTPSVKTDTARAVGTTVKRADTDKSFYYNDPTSHTNNAEATYSLKDKLGSAKFTELYSNSSEEHTLTVFYLERGTRESNCKITFNFQNPDTLTVVNKMSTSGVNPSLKPAAQEVADKESVGFRIQSNGTTNSIDSPDANVNTDAELEKDFSDGGGTAATYSLTFQDIDGTEITELAKTGIKPGTSVKLPDTAQSAASNHADQYIAGWKLVTGGTTSGRVYRTYTVNSNATFRAVWEDHASTSSSSASAPKEPSILTITASSSVPEMKNGSGAVTNNNRTFINATSNPPDNLYFEEGGIRWPDNNNANLWDTSITFAN